MLTLFYANVVSSHTVAELISVAFAVSLLTVGESVSVLSTSHLTLICVMIISFRSQFRSVVLLVLRATAVPAGTAESAY